MANPKVLDDIRREMSKLEKDYKALVEAYNLIAATSGKTAEKSSLSGVLNKVSAAPKSKAPAKAPAPKAKKEVEAPKKEVKAKRGRKPKVAPKAAPKVVKAAKAPKAAKPAKKVAKKATAKPAASKGKKRGRVGNLSEIIQETIGKTSRYMTNAQITDKIVSRYPGKDRSDLGKYISVILAIMKKKKLLGCITEDGQGNRMRSGLWGLPTWFDNGKPKMDYMR